LAFCVEDPASPPANLPTGRPCVRTPVLVDYGPGCRWDFKEAARRLLKLADRDPEKLIGVFTPNNSYDKAVAIARSRPSFRKTKAF